IVFRLQKRIYAARKQGNLKKVNWLQRKLIKSRAAMFLAVRKVTQLNAGKKTAGIDGKTALTEKERMELIWRLETEADKWKPSPVRQVLIPKPDGTPRKLGIPTIADRAWQALVTLALEPGAEATFHANSYGFRPGRGSWDAHKVIWIRTCKGSKASHKFSGYIYELDIEKCFDKIDHLDLIKRVELPKDYRHSLFKMLKAGVVVNFNSYESTEQGTPQGGVVSPLLANISLNGIETLGSCVRYADDMVYIIRNGENVEHLKTEIESFLAIRGLNIKASKTKLVDMKEGFNFLGLNFFRKPSGTTSSKPKKDWLKETRKKIRNLIESSGLPKEVMVKKVCKIMEGKRRFYQYSDLSKGSGEWWKLNQYVNQKLGKGFPELPYHSNRHINVKGEKSPYDGDWEYWVQRNKRRYERNIRADILKHQAGKCGMCGLYIMENMESHLHHKDQDHANNRLKNLQMVHRACHMLHHRTKVKANQATCDHKLGAAKVARPV
ncbi:MAG TPA: reverse transcriptase domain-containing protein, partial [Candidatus Competibacteraceae bacterium]|nr:reverse transcriptase domain-containing protein [Candidatus Competibacteraceae bacterium]